MRTSRRLDELTLARADGSYPKLLGRLARLDLLILDDFLMTPPTEMQRRDLLEVLEDRYGTRSTLCSSQLPVDAWHAQLGEPTLADALLDRLIHNVYRLVLKGPMRRKESKPQNPPAKAATANPTPGPASLRFKKPTRPRSRCRGIGGHDGAGIGGHDGWNTQPSGSE